MCKPALARHLTVRESGFASLSIPAGREILASFESHSNGSTKVMRALADYIEGDRERRYSVRVESLIVAASG